MSFTPIIEYSVIGITCLAMLMAARSDLRTRIVSDTYWMIIMLTGAAGGAAVRILDGSLLWEVLAVAFAQLLFMYSVLCETKIPPLFIEGASILLALTLLSYGSGDPGTEAGAASVLFCINPLFTMVLAHFFANEPMTKKKGIAFGISLGGIFMMIRPWDIQEGNTAFGLTLMLLAALTFSIYTIMGKRTLARIGNTLQTSLSFLYGAAVLFVIMLFMKRPILTGLAENWLAVLYIGVVVTGIGYLAYFKAIEYSDATTGSITFLIKPAIAPFIAMILLVEHMLWNSYAGLILILAASLLNLFENRAQHRQALMEEKRIHS